MKTLFPYCVCVLIVLTGCATAGGGKNRATALFDGNSLAGWSQIPPNSWIATNGVMASLGVARGVIYTTNDYRRFRLEFGLWFWSVASRRASREG